MKLNTMIWAAAFCFIAEPLLAQTEEKPLTIGPRFQYETCYDTSGMRTKQTTVGKDLPIYKTYPDARKIKLPAPLPGGMAVEKALVTRKSIRKFTEQPMTPEQLSQLLLAAGGLTHTLGKYTLRSVPSAGAKYPIELYVFAHNVSRLDSGMYHFQVSDSSLELVKPGAFALKLREAALGQEAVGASPITLVFTARFDRTTQKYEDRGYRYVYLDAGVICQSIYLEATSLGLGTVAIGAFYDGMVDEIVGIDGNAEGTVLIMPVGFPGE